MCRILIFGGTTEGRLLSEYCHNRRIAAWVSVVSHYGAELLPESEFLQVLSGRMTETEMEAFIKQEAVSLVFDATHPYALEVTGNIRNACGCAGIPYYRVTRESAQVTAESEAEKNPENGPVYVHTVEEAVSYLRDREGGILVTTGSKELAAFTGVTGYKERVYARVLPSCASISACEELGISGKHIIAMQGPFSEEMNRAVMNQLGVRFLVTKEAGAAGGFLEKLSAAEALGVISIVIGRPAEEAEGITVDEAEAIIEETAASWEPGPVKRNIVLIGTGMGGPGQMTAAAAEAAKGCDVLFGARRMTESWDTLGMMAERILKVPIYTGREILAWLDMHPEYIKAGVLYSGDTGFYSGASQMAKLLSKEPYCDKYEFTVYPGISSPSYLCARLGRSWEHVKLISLHGRDWDIAGEVMNQEAVFALLGGDHTVKELCEQLMERGLSHVRVTVGERLSYPEERIVSGTPAQCAAMEFTSLAVVLIERETEEKEGFA